MGVALLAGPANVIMELARPGVGYGVMESRVESGRADRHPIKRARTTFTYLAVATRGSDEQKKAYRRAVNKSHAQVYSTPDSPVQYNAFDKDLQLWVAACLYKGGVDIARVFIGEMDDETADRHYRESMALATTLQVPAEMWPADRAAFDRYWQESLDKVHIDDTIREYLYPFAVSRLRGVRLPARVQRAHEATQPAHHHRVPAAALPRRNAARVERGQAAQIRPVDGGHPIRQQPDTAVHPRVPVQSAAARRGLANPHWSAVGVSPVRIRAYPRGRAN